MQSSSIKILQKEYLILIAILLLALVNGLLYVFIVPPWQHYDEPNHFEFVWLLAKRGWNIEPGDYDTEMRRGVAKSMISHGFFKGMPGLPDLTSEKPWIGEYPKLDQPRLYYLLASIPLRVLSTNDVAFQLYAARLVSLVLLLITIFTGYGLVTEITPARHPLRFIVPLTMALLPAFVDLMTAVNNDVGAIAAFSLFLWGSTRLIRRGFSIWTFLFVLLASGLCIFTKRTVYLTVPLLAVVLLFTILRGPLRKIAWGLMIFAVIAGIFAVFSWGDATLWYRNTPQGFPTRNTMTGVWGDSALHIQLRPGNSPAKLVQILPVEVAKSLSGQPLTLGAWIWGSQPMEIDSVQFFIFDQQQIFGQSIAIDETPQFRAIQFTPVGNSARAWVILEPGKDLTVEQPFDVFYDGVVLAAGDFPVGVPPELSVDGSAGTWDGVPFENIIRNGSAESSWLYLRPWAETIATSIFSDYAGQEKFSLTLYSLLDWPSTGWYYSSIATILFRTFWAIFGWGHVPLLEIGRPYKLVYLPLTLLAFLGVILGFWQRRKHLSGLPWDVFFLLGITSLIIWGMVFVRGASYLLTRPAYFIVARYAYPAIIPSVLFLNAGWLSLFQFLEKSLHLPGWVKYVIHLGLFLVFDIYALASIIYFYR